MRLLLAFGLSFELPVIIDSIAWLDILSKEALIKRRRLTVVGMILLAVIITSVDVLSMILLALSLLFLISFEDNYSDFYRKT
jgi:Sec-independent protein secretion pathway component TatC